MSHRPAVRMAVVASVSALSLASAAAPAPAHTASCTGIVTLTLGTGIYYLPPVAPYQTNVAFQLSFDGVCAQAADVVMQGVLHAASCGDAVGSGVADDGVGNHSFAVRWVTSGWVMTGGVTGTLNLSPVPGQSCLPGGPGVREFLGYGSFALV